MTLTTLLYIRGVHTERFVQDLNNFDVYRSVVDLWAASLVRSSLLMGAAIGVSRNTTEGPKRVKDLETFTIVMCLLTGMYSVIKLLLYSEVMESLSDPWFLCLVAWTCVSALATFLTWKLHSLVQPLTVLALQVSILYYGGHLVVSGHLTSGNLISFIIYELELGDCMENIGAVYTGLMQGVGAAEKVFEFIDRKPQLSSDGTLAPDTLKGLVEFKNVTFSYPTRPETQVLKDVSFTLHPGQVTALVGPSGSGKSSCVSLLEHFYRAQAGQVLLDGSPIEEYDHRYLHTKVSLVGQEPVLFARSVQENIAYGLTDCCLEEIVQASMKANAHGFITELPDGYSTDAGEKGAQLSGGQKQRVAIARALVRSPHVLILDEATSALDAESEHIVQQALNGIMQDRTVLVIAHRLSTVEKAHNIIVIDKGEVLEQGTHRDLMQKDGLYSKLVKRQILGIETGTETMNRVTSNPPNTLRKQRESKRKSTESDEEFHV
ncbi:UNVERIFIED_CONTAM: hypothetical protein FKN15_054383 [Acipenser sinensis]